MITLYSVPFIQYLPTMQRGRWANFILPCKPWYRERQPEAHIRTEYSTISQSNKTGSWKIVFFLTETHFSFRSVLSCKNSLKCLN